ncbi:Abi-alpha family protein [Mucilaginibacter sp.]|uniref:Abi-alpha family protein n=1 Tax=Mucilaginibacter sp. TaxID=1882438 RepID=UPI0025D8841E|nr:Abi-alpha family protein [Mucilaginibacter sp.]
MAKENKSFKVDFTSKAVEKAIDIAKDFLDKLIMPSIEEAGLLIKDQVTYFKFKNQIRILNKSKVYCEKAGISTKAISLKLLCPLLENAALEEDEYLQDKWAILLGNLVDSEQNIENHVFPYILSQLSSSEFQKVNDFVKLFTKQKLAAEKASNEFDQSFFDTQTSLQKERGKLAAQIHNIDDSNLYENATQSEKQLLKHYDGIEEKLENLTSARKKLQSATAQQPDIRHSDFKQFEIENLIRLGILKEFSSARGVTSVEVSKNTHFGIIAPVQRDPITAVYNITTVRVTDLGMLFFKVCNEKDA